ncbi:hypothetical protein COV16_02910 [Candidatus Woesearchaeota archaeon CG10_big_fil_rev_8_21_14_0_10_34_8]|nr:MAG: hypothetical protein COV16_02910 [Candidatus Woesearchaeota archaeon CG10_big_fil_rev_8_21_14_0_10_34_8]
MIMLMNLTVIATIVSTILLLILIGVYFRNLSRIKSAFTIGLCVFACLFLLQNLVSLYFFFTMTDLYVDQVALHVFIYVLLQVIAFSVLLGITWE